MEAGRPGLSPEEMEQVSLQPALEQISQPSHTLQGSCHQSLLQLPFPFWKGPAHQQV